ncbi:hypothetical protein B9T25_08500 [Acinetobacter sp. ANC 4470]|uniref:hypothetical protein n=1 Tax=Acinetobacter sp. ANC 4470 TaxID=1977881 RepID=UPI000A358056|nr:hypothetical protein [Acinetobacter sp. ANC 4470]OTG68006.1 hypothetical protein B9T25_08500 [Acinetobacter sp. ANC 4470]
MNKHNLNIAIAGLSINHSEELKIQLRNLIPQNYMIEWVTTTDPNIDCLFIDENFYKTENIQKISKPSTHPVQLKNNLLFLPITEQQNVSEWINPDLINVTHKETLFEEPLIANESFDKKFFLNLNNTQHKSKLHLQDDVGTLAVIDPAQNIVWLNTQRITKTTNYSFHYNLANTTDLTKVSRKDKLILQDWLWNLFWNSPEIIHNLAPEDGHYKIHTWPKPSDQSNRKIIFQLSACFIQGGKISKIAEQLNLSQNTVQHFIATNIAANNIEKINIWDKHYTPPPQEVKQEEQNTIQSFFGKLRRKFGF